MSIKWAMSANRLVGDSQVEGFRFDSSVIHSAVHSGKMNKLLIIFDSGKTYVYYGVTREVWDDFKNAESQGKFFNEHIRGKYEFELEYEPEAA